MASYVRTMSVGRSPLGNLGLRLKLLLGVSRRRCCRRRCRCHPHVAHPHSSLVR